MLHDTPSNILSADILLLKADYLLLKTDYLLLGSFHNAIYDGG